MALPERELRRTARQLALPGWGVEQQERLHGAHVLVIGAGGLGCPAMQSLASAGVGHISVIDDDTVDITNIHRQILFGASDVGRPKVEVAAERLRELQPDITVTALRERLTVANAVALVGSVDLVLDGSDSFTTKYLVADAAEITGTPLVWGTVLRFRGDVCLWADGVGLRDLFPVQPTGDSIPDCATAGVLGATTATIGALMATETIKFLAGLPTRPGRMLSYDALTATTRSFTVVADPQRPRVTSLSADYADAVCAVGPDPQALLDDVRHGRAILLDIREPHEKLLNDSLAHLNPVRLPLSDIFGPGNITRALGDAERVIVHCASGVRSAEFCRKYADLGYEFIDLPGGINGLR
ncbi:ThiF family adenylyltransferase [Corynebacterium comes]|uniref:Adenylyltransferase/sulfurtransferase MoeZ n=1 Tax=Corynebacterium comes TaxID=2675218 RepID=A0A6B8W1X2_9CORY|nr:ThiF family adenylyltransferase [Corynebacterium comes]QGU04916.1 putative adenylyltransferase/sulfurtransferase MoeZ [Corynebacterium comes]